jgi:hypothetical protein
MTNQNSNTNQSIDEMTPESFLCTVSDEIEKQQEWITSDIKDCTDHWHLSIGDLCYMCAGWGSSDDGDVIEWTIYDEHDDEVCCRWSCYDGEDISEIADLMVDVSATASEIVTLCRNIADKSPDLIRSFLIYSDSLQATIEFPENDVKIALNEHRDSDNYFKDLKISVRNTILSSDDIEVNRFMLDDLEHAICFLNDNDSRWVEYMVSSLDISNLKNCEQIVKKMLPEARVDESDDTCLIEYEDSVFSVYKDNVWLYTEDRSTGDTYNYLHNQPDVVAGVILSILEDRYNSK